LYFTLRHIHSLLTTGGLYPTPWQQHFLHDILASISPGTRYLSQQAFRIMHSGPVMLATVLLRLIAVPEQWLTFRVHAPWYLLLCYSICSVFVLPKLLMLTERMVVALRQILFRPSGNGRQHEYLSDLQHDHADVATPWSGMTFSRSVSLHDDDLTTSELLMTRSGRILSGQADSFSQLPTSLPVVTEHLVVKTFVLSLVEFVFSTATYTPELIVETVRAFWAVRAFVTSKFVWKPQDTVEREVEDNLSVHYVSQQTWYVSAAGFAVIVWSMLGFVPMDPLLAIMSASWLAYPFVVYFLCFPVSDANRRSWLCRWVDEVLQSSKDISASAAASGGGGCVAFCRP